MRKLILAVIMVAFVTMPAYAAVQNIKVGGSLNSIYAHRDNFDFGLNTANDLIQDVIATIATLKVDADLTEKVSATIALINERDWGEQNISTNTEVNVLLAYVTLREMLYSPLTVIVGRQAFSYGNSAVISSASIGGADSGLVNVIDDINKGYAADAVRLVFDYSPLTLELLWAKIDQNTIVATASPTQMDDIDLYGLNATYDLGDDLNTQVESYFFAKIDKSTLDKTASAEEKEDTIYMPGILVSTNPLEGLSMSVEYAHQFGNKQGTSPDAKKRDANFLQVLTGYQLPEAILPDKLEEYNPSLQYEFTYASGDPNSDSCETATGVSEEIWSEWDSLYEDQHGGTIFNGLFSLSNLVIHRATLSLTPIEDVLTKLSFAKLYLAKQLHLSDNANLNRPDNSGTFNVSEMWDKRSLGWELDWETLYDYTEDVQLGLMLSWYNPGAVFSKANEDAAKQVLLNMAVNF